MFRSEKVAADLRWHFNNKSTDGKLRHPVDSVTWQSMNNKYPSFATEQRNMRLGLSTDGFNPFNMKNSRYNSWLVFLVNYSMAPDLCMKEENIMLSLLIPGPHKPGNSIDVDLEPLIEDLNHLWSKGEITYDAFSKTTFMLRAMLIWTISDLRAYGNRGRILTGRNISLLLRNYKNDFGNRKETRKKRSRAACEIPSDNEDEYSESDDEEEDLAEKDEEELSRLKKRLIFFTLPYWEELPVRHKLDEIHVEKNVAARLTATLLHCGNSKDGLKARKDLETLGIRKNLHPKAHGPDGYFSNISTCVSLDECKVMGLKSHDYHVLVQQLLLVDVRGLLPKGPRIAIFRLCAFFNTLCQRVIDMEQLQIMETEIVETLCMFERFWPPSFFDIMLHLCVHLGREARLGGPVHFRWMYPSERYIKVLKDYVRNPTRPEVCIAESYLAEECMNFCSDYLKATTNVEEKEERNTEYENHSILEGVPISAGTSFTLTDMDRKIAHLAIIQNTTMVEPYIDAHLQHLQDSNGRCRRDASYLWTMHTQHFPTWLKQQIPIDYEDKDKTFKLLAYGPRSIARSYTGYIVNGMRFHTKSVHRLNQNSGVYYEATTMCRSSAGHTAQVVDVVSYYGRIVDIILLDYNVFYVPIFRCQWAVKGNSVKVEDGFTLVNMNQSQVSFANDPFILVSQARQIFYSRENDESCWYVVLKGPSRRYNDENVEDEYADVGPLPSDIDMTLEGVSDEAQNVRDDCE
ncbi:PREDICTED: uncharacterized protein LOC104720449 [Camelina sativa]|uniref:Uncharacterized protein LOC104720449 n=1 Tax=Camelina sativa TaxID=90675 RepID=A0ABM0U6I4_CAMSA|nr:PREDICTED: uncharacterized protein LOC104720449 [Camelina sativa]